MASPKAETMLKDAQSIQGARPLTKFINSSLLICGPQHCTIVNHWDHCKDTRSPEFTKQGSLKGGLNR